MSFIFSPHVSDRIELIVNNTFYLETEIKYYNRTYFFYEDIISDEKLFIFQKKITMGILNIETN